MRAARVHQFGTLADIAIDEVPTPVPAAGEILVRVAAAALNPIDYKVTLGLRGNRALPLTLGFDAVGTVEALGAGVVTVAVGDRVCVMTDLQSPGTAADFVIVREHNVALVPNDVPTDVAAGLPLAALTALQVWDLAGLESGQSVLVHAGAGGVGHLAIQLAKSRGAVVYATASAHNLEFLESLGADHPVNYHATPPARFAALVDVVLDTQGGEIATTSLGAMKPGATLVSIVGYQADEGSARDDVRVERLLVEPRANELADLVARVADHRLQVAVQETVPLERVAASLEALHAGHTVGKRVLRVG